MIKEFISAYGGAILETILLAIIGFFGAKLKSVLDKKEISSTKKQTVRTCVKAVEQIYHALSGPEKLEYCKANILQMLGEKGIDITDLEMTMLIESVVSEFNLDRLWGGTDDDA